jgi:HK97 gp10 family phage protein
MVNQFRFDVFNDAFYAAFIEDGTVKMTPRRPLGNAVDQVSNKVPGEMGKVVAKAWRV